MNKLMLTSGIWILAVSAGLIGCEKAKKEVDVYRVNPPKVVKAGDPVEFKAFTENPARELDIQDQFDISDGSPVKTDVETKCVAATGETHSLGLNVNGHPDLKVFSLIPEPILVGKFDREVTCEFTFTFYNSAGSRHIFSLPSTKIVDRSASLVKIALGNVLAETTSYGFFLDDKRLNETYVRFANQKSGDAQIACDFANYPPTPIRTILTFGDLNLTKGTPRPGYESQAYGSDPYQSCRVIISDGGKRIGVSPAFTYSPKVQSITVTQEPRPAASPHEDRFRILWDDYIETQKAYPFSTVTLNNVTPSSRTVRIGKELQGAEFQIYLSNYMDRQIYHDPAKGFVMVNTSPRAKLTEDSTYFYLTIPAGDFVSMSASIVPRKPPVCFKIDSVPDNIPGAKWVFSSVIIDPSAYRNYGLGFGVASHGSIDELNSAGEVINTVTFSWGDSLAISYNSLIELDGYQDTYQLPPPCAFEVEP